MKIQEISAEVRRFTVDNRLAIGLGAVGLGLTAAAVYGAAEGVQAFRDALMPDAQVWNPDVVNG